uniref:vesicle-associated membrane protein 3 n=1 Tax=Ictidomys tridecemlineatus TaxID=43179 RepID=UPI001A9F660C
IVGVSTGNVQRITRTQYFPPACPVTFRGSPGAALGVYLSRSAGAPAGSSAATGSNRRIQQTQNQVDEVVDIMRVNVDKVLERDQKLSELDDRADALQAGASQFETSAAKLKRKYWWKNCKMWAIGISVLIIIIIIIIVWSVS